MNIHTKYIAYSGLVLTYILFSLPAGVRGDDIPFSYIDGRPAARCRIIYGGTSIDANVVFDIGQLGSVFVSEKTGKMLGLAGDDTVRVELAGGVVLENLNVSLTGSDSLDELTEDYAGELDNKPAVAVLGLDAFAGHTFAVDGRAGKIHLTGEELSLVPTASAVYAFKFERGSYGLLLSCEASDGFELKAGISTRIEESLIDTAIAGLISDTNNNIGKILLGGIVINDYTPLRLRDLSGGSAEMPSMILGNVFFESFVPSIDTVNDVIQFKQVQSKALKFPEQAYFDAVRNKDPNGIEDFIKATEQENHYYGEAADTLVSMRLSAEPFDAAAWMRAVEYAVGAAKVGDRPEILILYSDSLRDAGVDRDFVLENQLLEMAGEWAGDTDSRTPLEIEARLGLISLEQGDVETARRRMLSVVFEMPQDVQFNYWLGRVYEAMGKPLRAWSRYSVSVLGENAPPEAFAAIDRLNNNAEFRKYFNMQDASELLEGRIPDFHPEKRIDKRPAIHSVELFTCVDNPACGPVELAVRGLKEYLGGYGVTVVDYHLSSPEADPLESRIVANRADYYGVTTTPALFIDGGEVNLSGFAGMDAAGVFNELSGNIATIEKKKGKMTTNSERLGQEIEIDFHPLVDGIEYQSAVLLVEEDTMSAGASGLWLYSDVVRHGIQSLFDNDRAVYKVPAADVLNKDIDATVALMEQENGAKFALRPWYVDADRCRIVVIIQEKDSKRVVRSFSLPYADRQEDNE